MGKLNDCNRCNQGDLSCICLLEERKTLTSNEKEDEFGLLHNRVHMEGVPRKMKVVDAKEYKNLKNSRDALQIGIDKLKRANEYYSSEIDRLVSVSYDALTEIELLKEEITRLNNRCMAFAETLDITMILKNGLKEEIEAKDNRINELIEEIKVLKPYETLQLLRRRWL